MKPNTLLIIDDEPNICFSLSKSLERPTLRVLTAGTAKEGWEIIQREKIGVVLLDVRLPDLSGLDLYERIARFDPRLPVVIMTAFSRAETAIEATRRGAFDYLVKPVDLSKLRESIDRALEATRICGVSVLLNDSGEDPETDGDSIVGLCAPMQEVYKSIGRVATQNATVLILGESGTGKELVARAIWNYSGRKDKPFLAINCAAIPESLLESELFGHERGAFTGADQRRIGKFEKTHGGTIFLDEIGDMSAATQAKALRLLQQQQFERVGGNAVIQTDVRVIAATNRDLESMVERNLFRGDLFYRLNGLTIRIPPLRDRLEDVPLLVKHYLRRLSKEFNRNISAITPEAIECMGNYRWPGNVRELLSALRYAVLHSSNDVITIDALPESCRTHGKSQVSIDMPTPAAANAANGSSESKPSSPVIGDQFDISVLARQLLSSGNTNIYREVGTEVDKVVLNMVMNHVGGNQMRAAEILGISRVTLRTKLRTLAADEASSFVQDDGEPTT